MSSLYPEGSARLNVIGHLEELRKRILICLLLLAVAAILAFSQGDRIMMLVRRPIRFLLRELIFISPTEAFASYIKVSLLSGFIVVFPLLVFQAWRFLAPALTAEKRRRIALWLFFSIILFFSGIAFSYFIAVPAALTFLIDFGSSIAVPRITLGKYVSFFGALMLVGGIVFEIPVVMGLLADAGLTSAAFLRKKRPYAFLGIMIFAAVITPTQDILNMLLFALPMALLYEVGILVAVFMERKRD